MHSSHAKNTVRYYILAVLFLAFLFLSNDFGQIDVQKTAIVTAVGIDREEDGFILTSQIAVPQTSKQGKASEPVQLVSRGKTISEAFDQINAKTGWYPKLVFCNLLVIGQNAAKQNVFDALDFFLRDEYLSDDCQVAVCEGSAQELLNTSALIDPSSSVAISKVLSPHAERVGTVRPSNLKDFAIGHFGESKSGMLPVLKTQPQQEITPPKEKSSSDSQSGSSEQSGESSEGGGSSSQSEEEKSGEKQENKPVFSARETALFVGGVWRETLTAEETFALDAATGKLRLAGFTVEVDGQACTLSVKRNLPEIKLNVGKDGRGQVHVKLQMIAGVADFSKAQAGNQIKDMGGVPDGAFAAAEKKLSSALITAYEKARGVNCDLFQLQERLIKYKKRQYAQYKDTLPFASTLSVEVKFSGVR